jgi:hypothetical protein
MATPTSKQVDKPINREAERTSSHSAMLRNEGALAEAELDAVTGGTRSPSSPERLGVRNYEVGGRSFALRTDGVRFMSNNLLRNTDSPENRFGARLWKR